MSILAEGEQWRVIEGDARLVLPTIKPAVIIADVPYGIAHKCNYQEAGRGRLADCNDYPDVIGDDEPFDPSFILEMDVPTVLWGANHYADKLPTGGWIVWDKERPHDYHASPCEMAWTNIVKSVYCFRHLWHGMMRASERGQNYHPTQKPVALCRWVLSLPWIPVGLVADPYCGSGPMGVACAEMGRPYVGIEIEPKYAAIARRRISEAAPLFVRTPEPDPELFGAKP